MNSKGNIFLIVCATTAAFYLHIFAAVSRAELTEAWVDQGWASANPGDPVGGVPTWRGAAGPGPQVALIGGIVAYKFIVSPLINAVETVGTRRDALLDGNRPVGDG